MSGRGSKKKRSKGASAPGTSGSAQPGPSAASASGAASAPGGGSPGRGAALAGASLLDAPLEGTARRAALAGLALWILVQIAIPLRYYLGGDLYDERFAWRMFSAVRVQECEIAVAETRDGHEVALHPMTFLPAPWVGLLERSRPAVVRGFLDWRCETGAATEGGAPEAVSVRSSCVDATGDPLPSVVRALTCSDRAYEERTLGADADEESP